MISASNIKETQDEETQDEETQEIEETQEVFIKTDVVEIKSEAEEAGGNWQENVRIVDVRSENSIPNSNQVENPTKTEQDRQDMVQRPEMGLGPDMGQRLDMVQRPDMAHRPDMINQAICKHCLATFTDPFGRAKLSHHIMTFHFNHNPEIHMVSPHSIMPTPPGTPRPLRTPGFPGSSGTPGHLGTPGFPGPPGTPGHLGTPEVRRRLFTSTFIPSRPEMVHGPEMVHRPEIGQRPFVPQQPLPHRVTPNDIMKEYILRQQERERIRFQQTMHPMHPGAQQVNEETK